MAIMLQHPIGPRVELARLIYFELGWIFYIFFDPTKNPMIEITTEKSPKSKTIRDTKILYLLLHFFQESKFRPKSKGAR